MEIYERIYARLGELKMSQSELSRRTGIATSTINDWKKKKINPQSDRLVTICNALGMTLGELLGVDELKRDELDYSADERHIIECYRRADSRTKNVILTYLKSLGVLRDWSSLTDVLKK